MANPIFTKLQKDLRLLLKRNKQGDTTITPGVLDRNKDKVRDINLNNFSNKKDNSDFKRLWDLWLTNTYDSPDSFKNRFDRYSDCEFAYYNDPIFSMACDLIADETPQVDSNDSYLEVYAKNSKFQKAIEEFLSLIGITQNIIREVAFNLALYGDAFLVSSVHHKEGITKVTPINPYSVKQRLEFSLSRAAKEFAIKNGGFAKMYTRRQSLEKLYALYQNTKDDISEIYREFLFGYELDGQIFVAPWNVFHFRRFSTSSEFWPFGRPPMIHAISPYRQLSAGMNLQEMARIASFPIKHYQVETNETMTEIEKWDAVNMSRQEYHNLGVTNSGKDEFSINDEIWTPKDYLDVDVIDPNMDLDSIKDIEMLQDRMLIATRIPKGYLPIGNDNGWGESGKSLVQQSKVFGRYVYTNQQAIVEQIIHMIKTHFSITGEFKDEDFEISMPFPVIEESRDRISVKNDTLRLANDILQNLGQALGLDRDEALPIDIVKDIFSTYSFLDPDELDKWIKTYTSEKESPESKEEGSSGYRFEHTISSKKRKLIEEIYTEDFKRNFYFDVVKNHKTLQERVSGGRHIISSRKFANNSDNDLIYSLLSENRKKIKENVNNLQESADNNEIDLSLSKVTKIEKATEDDNNKKSFSEKVTFKEDTL